MRACFSGAAFVMAFASESQQAFLEGHVRALEWFAGVFDVIRYDNLKAGGLAGVEGPPARRVRPVRALRSHYRFESSFCLWVGRAHMRRAGSRARSGASAAATWCRSRRWARSRS